MNPRLQNVPIYETRQAQVPAEHFNLSRMAIKRVSNPMRVLLPKLRTLELILEEDAWIVVDHKFNDVPVVAWLEFAARNRALHEPVPCRLNLYHMHGEIILEKVMEAMAILVGEKLAQKYPEEPGDISVLKSNDK